MSVEERARRRASFFKLLGHAKRSVAFVFILAFLSLASHHARADELFGANVSDAFALGKAHAVTASVSPIHAAFANPAALINEENSSIAFSVSIAKDYLRVMGSRSQLSTYPSYNIAASTRLAFPAPVSDRFFLGIQVQIPNGELYKLVLPHEDEIVALFYGDNQRKTSIYAAVGVRLWERLSLGFGLSVSPHINGDVKINFQETGSDNRVDVAVKVGFAPTFGLYWEAFDGLKLGFSYRAAQRSKVRIPVNVHVSDNLPTIYTQISGYAFGGPHSLNLGVSYEFNKIALQISGDLAYEIFHKPILSAPSVTLFDAEGQSLQHGVPTPFSLNNRFIARFSATYSPIPSLGLSTGYAFRQSPVPAQRARSNLVDSHTHRLALGAEYCWSVAPTLELRFATGLAADILTPRRAEKLEFLPQNPAFPRLDIEGWALAWQFSTTLHFR
ncbi:MAG: hypothetical protein WC966_08920 [Bradymonadales bacterium]|jgi:long-subunit fatty acid transport protein